ncbi:hypothetical protein ACYSNR_07375 [Enterococcus sp. LJL128]|uniref:hypothetical protein n=1 Tax=Enterococcus sp. LJL51 TaxID=3416656 RepID=UPI003CE96D90
MIGMELPMKMQNPINTGGAANKEDVTVFSLGSEGPDVGVMSVIESQGKSGKILHYGFDYTDTWLKGVDNGRITAIVD